MKIRLLKNLPLKIISIGISLFLWTLIMNTIHPIISDYVNVPVSIINEDVVLSQNKVYTILDTKVCKINYKVSQEQSSAIRQSDFKAYIDLKNVFEKNELPIQIEILNGIDKYVTNVVPDPKFLKVSLSELTRNEINVKYSTSGNLLPGYIVGSIILSPNTIFISGSEDIISKVANATIDISLDGHDESFSGQSPLKFVDELGNEIKSGEIEANSNEIQWTVNIFTQKNIMLNAVVEGNPKPGFNYAGVQIQPSSIIIEGQNSVLNSIYSIDLPKIDITDLDKNNEYTFSLSEVLPVGTRCRQTDTVKVVVNINRNGPEHPLNDMENGPHILPNESKENNMSETEETETVSVYESKENHISETVIN